VIVSYFDRKCNGVDSSQKTNVEIKKDVH